MRSLLLLSILASTEVGSLQVRYRRVHRHRKASAQPYHHLASWRNRRHGLLLRLDHLLRRFLERESSLAPVRTRTGG